MDLESPVIAPGGAGTVRAHFGNRGSSAAPLVMEVLVDPNLDVSSSTEAYALHPDGFEVSLGSVPAGSHGAVEFQLTEVGSVAQGTLLPVTVSLRQGDDPAAGALATARSFLRVDGTTRPTLTGSLSASPASGQATIATTVTNPTSGARTDVRVAVQIPEGALAVGSTLPPGATCLGSSGCSDQVWVDIPAVQLAAGGQANWQLDITASATAASSCSRPRPRAPTRSTRWCPRAT